ncbi:hypothetical protein G6O69_05190 [Pseudenhygromyxa sp. WMMC2535]|uniref:hypothetical protein n=1 Tax=Pseudenhygromyxa sp. WMMC2535 TaxID=2712867 RepID=UPI001552176A|nr:hypothetical protein [Pseudenhygromyxa sp. WMMC2535]NVB37215.1 hypothetical protein [Pseudenhygromyxa sp. WMMC2535]
MKDEDPVSERQARLVEVREALEAVQSALNRLADDLSTACNPSWDDQGDFEGAAREVLQVSAGLAQELVDWLEPMDLGYGDLDEVLQGIAARVPALAKHAKQGSAVFEFLRQVSYASSPDPHQAPDMEAFNVLLEELVDTLEEKSP